MPFTIAISLDRTSARENRWIQAFLLIFFSIWMSTLIGTSDINNWFLENTLVFLFLTFLIISYRRYQFSDLSYLLICVYLCLHVYGSKYTYAENPFGYWLQETFGTARNPYDRLVHFKFPTWVSWSLPVEITLSISGLYELIEWAVADLFFPAQGDAYLGTQGDIWDAQKDMFLATLGAVLATTIVSIIKKSFKIER
jgi:putative membrane protein